MEDILGMIHTLYSEDSSLDWLHPLMEVEASDDGINALLRMLGEKVESDRSYIFEVNEKGNCDNTYEWCAAGVSIQQEILQDEAYETIRWWFEEFEKGNALIIESLEDIQKEHPMAYALLKLQNIHSLIVVPLHRDGKVFGFIGVDNPATLSIKANVPILFFVANIAERVLHMRDLIQHMQRMSYRDQLTDALNRHALEQDLGQAATWETLGIVYCDVSELKLVNDTLGHLAGDQMLRACSEMLQKVFLEHQIYRIGGDEFLVLCPDIREEAFHKLIENFSHLRDKSEYHLAVGHHWTKQIGDDPHKAILVAEKAMYKDKAAYYTQSAPLLGHKAVDRRRSGTSRVGGGLLPHIGKNCELERFLSENFFDLSVFLDAIAHNDLYVYFGDLQRRCFYISDEMRDTFGFESNIALDLLKVWEKFIPQPEDLELYRQDMLDIQQTKRELHDLRYRVKDKDGKEFWVHCCGKILWDENKEKTLFFAGTVTKIEYEFIVDPITDFLREHGAIVKLRELQQMHRQISCIGFRLHHFQEINELRGRQTANEMLKDVANTLVKLWGETLIFFRLDGLRFIALVPPESAETLPVIALNMKKRIEKLYADYGLPMHRSCSLALMTEAAADATPQDILAEMNNLLDLAKDNPLQDFVVHSSQNLENRRIRSRMILAANRDVKRSFENFRMVIQPVVSMVDGYPITSGECLLRWKFEGQDISPAIFIPLLERGDQIIPIGKWVFEQAVRNCKRLATYQSNFYLNFNVSYPQILDEDFLPFMKRTLKKWDADGRHLVMEMTETHYNENPKKLTDFIDGCREMGMLIALDDFGTGYSSLELLMKYPSDIVKLDRSLMKEMTDSRRSNDFITSIVYACHKFGKKVCVEGVETGRELAIVRAAGCDMVQGFHFYRPMELPEFYALLAGRSS